MSWRDDKTEKLQKSRDFSFLQDGDRQKESQKSRQPRASEDRVSDKMNQEARDRLLRLKALEKQRAEKQKKHYVDSSPPDEHRDSHHRENDKNQVSFGNKRVSSQDQKFGSFFGKVEKVVAKRVLDEQRAREISARAARQAEAEKPRPKASESKKGNNNQNAKQSSRPSSGSGSKVVSRPQNPVTVKAQKLKDNRDYSFLFSEEPSKGAAAAGGGRDSRQEPKKHVADSRDFSEREPTKQKSHSSQTQRPKQSSNGVVRSSSDKGLSANGVRKPGIISRPSAAAEREKYTKDSSRQDSQRRPEKERSLSSSRPSSVSKNGTHPSSSSRDPVSRLPLKSDRDKRPSQERPKSVTNKNPTNHERPMSREKMKPSSLNNRVSQSSVQRASHSVSANVGSRDRVVQKSSTEHRVSQSMYISEQKRKMAGEPSRKPTVTAKLNNGSKVDRSRYQSDSDSEDERNTMKNLVSGGPRASQSSAPRVSSQSAGPRVSQSAGPRVSQSVGPRVSQTSVGLKRKVNDEPVRNRSAPTKESKRKAYSDSDMESESDDGGMNRGGISSIIQKLFRYNPNKYKDIDDEDDKNMETSFRHIQAEERRSAKLAREEDEREQEAIEREEKEERMRKLKRQKMK